MTRVLKIYADREQAAETVIKFKYPSDIFSEFVAKATKCKKIVSTVGKDNYGQSGTLPVTLFGEDGTSSDKAAIGDRTRSNKRRRSSSMSDNLSIVTNTNQEDYYEIIANLEYDVSDFVTNVNGSDKNFDSQVMKIDGFCDSIFQLRLFRMSPTSRKYGISLRTNKSMDIDIELKFSMKLTDHNVFCEEKSTLMAGCVEQQTSRLHLQAYTLFSRFLNSKSSTKIAATASCQLRFLIPQNRSSTKFVRIIEILNTKQVIY